MKPKLLALAPSAAALVFAFLVFLGGESIAVYGHGDTMSAATSISIGSSVSGAIDFEGDEDWFAVQEFRDGTNPIVPRVVIKIARPRHGSNLP